MDGDGSHDLDTEFVLWWWHMNEMLNDAYTTSSGTLKKSSVQICTLLMYVIVYKFVQPVKKLYTSFAIMCIIIKVLKKKLILALIALFEFVYGMAYDHKLFTQAPLNLLYLSTMLINYIAYREP